ncbi:hypothetical protein [Undibacterium curvum]|uniref:Lipoprotein n=1 Tax=Undibacterium curvum TaxID=2762294 RepID=A0ABR7A969_9BURK|nr:hypothetical protein [Undibacterium curvum]MBC3933436.1 hypothetical protein [Undibacterium curvum]
MRKFLLSITIVAFVLQLSACQSIRSGGAPDPSFNIDQDLEQLSKEFASATSISEYYKLDADKRQDARNRFVSGRLVQMDLQYLKFIRTLTADKQQLDAATDVVNMSLNLAGTLVGGLQAKSNLAVAAAGISGAKTTIDKDFYYEKSIQALVATMNAKRKEVLYKILLGLSASSQQYPFERAVTDLNEYYLAGTLNGALQFINTQAAESSAQSDKALAVLYKVPVPSQPQIISIGSLTDALGAPAMTLDKAKAILTALGVKPDALPATLDGSDGKTGALQLLKTQIRAAKNLADDTDREVAIRALNAAFKAQGF